MSQRTSFFVVKFTDEEDYSYWGPAMDTHEWSSYLDKVRRKAKKEIQKETGGQCSKLIKFRIDRILKQRGFNRHAEVVTEPYVEFQLEEIIL